MRDRRIKLVVLFGGRSAEHDVSCVSARHVLAASDPNKYCVEPIGITRQGRWVRALDAATTLRSGPEALPARLTATGPAVDPLPLLATAAIGNTDDFHSSGTRDFRSSGNYETGIDRSDVTVVLPVLHGPMGEDGTVQGLLEMAGVPYVGAGVLSSALCMDKAMAKTVLAAHGIAQSRWFTITTGSPEQTERTADAEARAAIEHLGLPVFVKPANMGSSVGISKARTVEEVVEAIRLASRYDRNVVVEEAINGREIEVAVLGNDDLIASIPGEIIPSDDFYSYEDKYSSGAELLVPAPLTASEVAEVQALAVRTCRLLKVEGMARVDFFYEDARRGMGDRRWLVGEINTIPGFTPISMYPKLWNATGLGYSDLIDRLVELAVERHTRQQQHTSTDRRIRINTNPISSDTPAHTGKST